MFNRRADPIRSLVRPIHMMGRTHDLLSDRSARVVRDSTASVIHGVRADGDSSPTIEDVRAALMTAYPDGIFCGWSAAELHGVPYSAGHPPELWLPEQRRRKGVVVRCGHLPIDDVTTVSGWHSTTIVRTVVDLARLTRNDEAVVAVDQFIRRDAFGRSITTKRAILRYLDDHPGLYGGTRTREVLDEADTGAQSPWETYSRLVVHRSGLDFFRTQQPIPGTPYHSDLGSGRYRVAIEYDGGYHRTDEQQRADVIRWNAITGQGWGLIRATSTTLLSGRAEFLDRVARELRTRGWSGPSPVSPRLTLPNRPARRTAAD